MSSHVIEGNQPVHQVLEAYTASKPVCENPVQQVAQGVLLREQSCASNSSEQFVFSEILLPNEAIYRILFSFIESLPPKEAAREIAQKALLSAQWRQVSRTLLTDCINTEKLSFHGIGVNWVGKLKCFLMAHGEGLRDLSLHGSIRVNASEVKELLALCPNLTSLLIYNATDSTLEDIATLKKLTHLQFPCGNYWSHDPDCLPFTDNGMKYIGQLTTLTHLRLRAAKLITDEAAKEISKLRKLEYLDLSYCTKLGDAAAAEIATLTDLEVLFLGYNQELTYNGVAEITKLKKLILLDLGRYSDCSEGFDDATVELIVSNLTGIEYLSLQGWRPSDDMARRLVKLPKLRDLNLNYTETLSKAVKEEIKASFKGEVSIY